MAAVVDCLVRHGWASELDLYDYFPAGWREYLRVHTSAGPAGSAVGPLSVFGGYRNPLGDDLPGSHAGTSCEALIDQHLDSNGIGLALLGHGDGLLSASLPTPRLAAEAARAINDWTADRWLQADRRLRAAILVATQLPDEAAAEIRRCAADDRMVAVAMGASGLAKPFGHPVYTPIHAAAHETGLPILLSAGGAATHDASVVPTAGGSPSTYAELRTLSHQALESHVASLITQGVMGHFPSLRFLIVGGGIGWVAPWLWRLDTNHRAFRYDSLWLKERLPSDVFREYFLVGTHPFNFAAAPDRLRAYFEADPTLAESVCYSSGYPDWDSMAPESVLAALPEAWADAVLSGNVRRLLGWSEPVLPARSAG